MNSSAILVLAGSLALFGCGRPPQREQPAATQAAVNSESTAPARPGPTPAAKSNAQTSLSEPNGAIDPKSAEAAGQLVQSYGALIEQKRWGEATGLWGDPNAAGKFRASLGQFADVHLEIGNPGDLEGAAGSIYVTIPAIFYGDAKDGQPFRRSADVVLRRVNDVPGSTEVQRSWHIERIDWAG
jgi:hypothetical protein